MRHAWLRPLLTALLLLAAAGFGALSAWQWQRLAWKEGLLARIERQQAAAPQPLPGAIAWAGLTPAADEYRPVTLRGQLEPQHEIRVLASTELGRGHWVMVPLRLPSGLRVWLNRGFVGEAADRSPAPTRRMAHAAPDGEIGITGLLRFSEPGHWLWQHNDPTADRWVGREVAALSRAVGIKAAPFFVDVAERGEQPLAEAVPSGTPGTPAENARSGDIPRGGLTVLRFSNNHRVYALTWLALAAGSVAAAVLLWRHRPDQAAA